MERIDFFVSASISAFLGRLTQLTALNFVGMLISRQLLMKGSHFLFKIKRTSLPLPSHFPSLVSLLVVSFYSHNLFAMPQ